MQVFANLRRFGGRIGKLFGGGIGGRFGSHLRGHTRELVVALVFAVAAALAYEWWHAREKADAIARAQEAVVTIIAYDGNHKAIAEGSGVFISASGLLATNFHVIKDAAEIEAHEPGGAFFRLDESHGVRFTDAQNDIALLDFEATNTPFVKLGDPAKLTAGEFAYVVGTPGGQARAVSVGNISYPDRIVAGQHLIQFSAAIPPGSSGGGLFVESGAAVGITADARGLPQIQNLNYAIPITYVRAALNKEAEIAQGSASYYYVQANLAADRRAWDLAIAQYTKAIALDPGYAKAYNGRGNVYYELGRYEDELADYLKASELSPADPDHAYNLGTAYDNVGRYEDAIRTYSRVLAREPNHTYTIQYLMLDYLAIGDKADAAALLPKLQKLNAGLGKQMALIVGRIP